MRQLARAEAGNVFCLANLTSLEYAQLQATLKKVAITDPKPVEKAPLKKGGCILKKKNAASSLKNESPQGKTKRKLKETPGNVSVDSKSWPAMLASPASSAKPPNLFEKRRRVCSRAMQEDASEAHPDLHLQMGLRKKPAAALKKSKAASKKEPLKKGKPAASKSSLKKGKAVSKSSLKKDTSLKQGKHLKKGSLPWVKLLKTTSRQPESHEKSGKPSLIVEVAKRRSLQYHWIIDSIMEALKKDNLTKEEALQIREDLCAKFFFEKGFYIVFLRFREKGFLADQLHMKLLSC